ncbi:MAG: DMT family transporter [Silicimonas sp.]|nr:DMT family transporter [Silicimonas sp.]
MARLFLLTTLTMVAFAANSILNRAALAGAEAGPAAFAAIRTLSGAICLAILVFARHGKPKVLDGGRWLGTMSLTLYMVGFSFAYVALEAGTGALILFGGTQVTMFAGALFTGDRPNMARWAGAVIAFCGLVWLLWPGAAGAPAAPPAILMAVAALGWGVYSLVGRSAADPLQETAANFICAAPIVLFLFAYFADGITGQGMVLAVASGAITSGLGYALWYSVLPKLETSVAALSQLTVPIIAAFGGAVLLAEPPTTRLLIATVIVLGGVALGVIGGHRKIGSSAS